MSQSQKIAHIKVGRRAQKEENLQNNWESLDVNKLNLLHGKILAVFGGNTTNDSASSNGNAKCIESTIDPEIRDKVKIYSFSYDSEPITSNGYLSKEYADESLLLYEKVFYPILFDDNGYMKEKKALSMLSIN